MPGRRRTAPRKARSLTARWLVTGTHAHRIQHHGQQAYLQPHRAGDHPKRYRPGQALQVKQYVPGPTECRITVTHADRTHHGSLADQDARDVGYTNLDDLAIAWVQEHDRDWLDRHNPDLLVPAILERYQTHWAGKLVWLIRFKLDIAADPYLLAAQSDELYVTNPAMAMRDELPALRPDEHAQHIGATSLYRQREHQRQQRHNREALRWTERLERAQADAKAKGYDLRDECRLYQRLIDQGHTDRAKAQLALIEARVYPAAA